MRQGVSVATPADPRGEKIRAHTKGSCNRALLRRVLEGSLKEVLLRRVLRRRLVRVSIETEVLRRVLRRGGVIEGA